MATLSVIVAVLCLLSLSTFFAIVFKKTILQTFILAVGFVVAVLFLSGLLNFLGCLLFGYWFLVCFSACCAVYSCHKIKIEPKIIKKVGLIPGLLTVTIFFILSVLWHYGRLLTPGDEFTHWGTVVKHMYMTDALGTIPGSTILLKGYLPGMSLLQYFFVAGASVFTPWVLYVATSALYLSVVANIVSGMKALRKVVLVTTAVLASLLFTYSFGYIFMDALSVDIILAVLFAFCVVSIVLSDRVGGYGILVLTTGCLLLTLTKDMGVILAAICVLVYIVDSLVRKDQAWRYIASGTGRKVRYLRAVVLVLPIIAAAAPYLLWKMNTQINKVQPWFDTNSIHVSNILTGNLKTYQVDTFHSYIKGLLFTNISGLGISFFTTMVLFLIAVVTLSLIQKDRAYVKRFLCMGLVVFFGSFIYAAVLLVLYMFVFYPGEATTLASYSRYVSTYALAAILILLIVFPFRSTRLKSYTQRASVCIINTTNKAAKYIKKNIFTILLILGCVVVVGKITHMRSYFIQYVAPYFVVTYDRVNEDSAAKWNHCLDNTKDVLYIVSSGDNGSRTTQLRYVFYGVAADIPTGITGPINSVKAPVYKDYWNQYVLERNTLLYVDVYDAEFESQHGGDFDKLSDSQLYRITKINGITKLLSLSSSDCSLLK